MIAMFSSFIGVTWPKKEEVNESMGQRESVWGHFNFKTSVNDFKIQKYKTL